MALTNLNTRGLLVDDVAALLVLPTLNQTIAARPEVSRRITTSAATMRMPIQTTDPSAGWVAEGAEIPVSDAVITEIDVTPSKLAALSIITSELANDSNPAAAQVVGAGMARDLARKIDAAFFGALATPAPSGLGALSGVQTVVSATAFGNLDSFAAAKAKAENVGADVTAFACSPNTALALAQVKQSTGSINSNMPLLGADGTMATQRMILGVPLLVSYAIPDNVCWALDADRVMMVVREDATVTTDSSVYYTSDRVAVRGTLRVGFGFVHAAAVVKITTA
jgi:HK97 family phage major capsid protein